MKQVDIYKERREKKKCPWWTIVVVDGWMDVSFKSGCDVCY